jgi:hypothetical protein
MRCHQQFLLKHKQIPSRPRAVIGPLDRQWYVRSGHTCPDAGTAMIKPRKGGQ